MSKVESFHEVCLLGDQHAALGMLKGPGGGKRLLLALDSKGWSPVLLAASQGHWQLVHLLLAQGARPHELVLGSGGSRSTLLHYLCSHRPPRFGGGAAGKSEADQYAKLLQSLVASQIDQRNALGETVFHRLAQHNNVAGFRAILPVARKRLRRRSSPTAAGAARLPSFADLINALDTRRWPALAVAVAAGSVDMVRALLEVGADANCFVRFSNTSGAAGGLVTLIQLVSLLLAERAASSTASNLQAVRAILVEQRQADRLALALAAVGQRADFLALLKTSKSVVFADDSVIHMSDDVAASAVRGEGLTPLHAFAMAGDHRALRAILPICPNEIINRPDLRGWTPLTHACFGGDLDSVELLLSAGASARPAPRLAQALLMQPQRSRSGSAALLAKASGKSGKSREEEEEEEEEEDSHPATAPLPSSSPSRDSYEVTYLSLSALNLANEAAQQLHSARDRRTAAPSVGQSSDDGDSASASVAPGARSIARPDYCGPSTEFDDDDEDDTLSILAALVQAHADGWHRGESLSHRSRSLSISTGGGGGELDSFRSMATAGDRASSSTTAGVQLQFGRHLPTPFAIHHFVKRLPPPKAEKQYEAILAQLIQADADPGVPNKHGDTPLHQAAFFGNAVGVRFLLKHGANPNAVNAMDETPLHNASRSGSSQIVALLLEAGANPLFDAAAAARRRPRSVDAALRPFSGGDDVPVETRARHLSSSALHAPSLDFMAAMSRADGKQKQRQPANLDRVPVLSRTNTLPVDVARNDATRRVLKLSLRLVHLPAEILVHVFSCAVQTRDDLVTLERVNKQFFDLVRDSFQSAVLFRRALLHLKHYPRRHWMREAGAQTVAPDFYFRVVFVGAPGIGKRRFITQFEQQQQQPFVQSSPPPQITTQHPVTCITCALTDDSHEADRSWALGDYSPFSQPAADLPGPRKWASAPLLGGVQDPASAAECVAVQLIPYNVDGNRAPPSSSVFRGAQASVFCFSTDDPASFRAVAQYRQAAATAAAAVAAAGTHHRFLLAFSSAGTPWRVPARDVEALALDMGVPLFVVENGGDWSGAVAVLRSIIDQVHMSLTVGFDGPLPSSNGQGLPAPSVSTKKSILARLLPWR